MQPAVCAYLKVQGLSYLRRGTRHQTDSAVGLYNTTTWFETRNVLVGISCVSTLASESYWLLGEFFPSTGQASWSERLHPATNNCFLIVTQTLSTVTWSPVYDFIRLVSLLRLSTNQLAFYGIILGSH